VAVLGDAGQKVQWLKDNNHPGDKDTTIQTAAKMESCGVEMLEWLKADEYELHVILDFALFQYRDDLAVFAWLVCNRGASAFRGWSPDVPFMQRLEAQGLLTETLLREFIHWCDIPTLNWVAAQGLRPLAVEWGRCFWRLAQQVQVEEILTRFDRLFCYLDKETMTLIVSAITLYLDDDQSTVQVFKRLKARRCPWPSRSEIMFRDLKFRRIFLSRPMPNTEKWLRQNEPLDRKVARMIFRA
jgi:hypothetical protein